ncbi:MAG: hypothetical protein RL412_1248 [Pseudomonadota bacterium]
MHRTYIFGRKAAATGGEMLSVCGREGFLSLRFAVIWLLSWVVGMASVAQGQERSTNTSRVIGFVVTTEAPGHWESPDAGVECPEGLHFTEKENWEAMNPVEREERRSRFGHRWNRGPNGENSTAVPWAIKDPLPIRFVQSDVALGFNLDGTEDGRETPNSCGHAKFKDPETGLPVDNQLYRVMGCAKGWRSSGAAAGYRMMEFPTYTANRLLLEISGVDDVIDDSEVEVALYKGLDDIPKKNNGEFLPGLPHRVDTRFPVIARTSGKIEGGVLTIKPVEHARFPMRWNVRTGTRDWYDMHLRLRLSTDGAEGLLGGYQDLEKYWLMYRRGLAVSVDNSAWSPPSMYAATEAMADGRRDPNTGRCSAISSSMKLKAVRAFIVHAEPEFDQALFDLRGY